MLSSIKSFFGSRFNLVLFLALAMLGTFLLLYQQTSQPTTIEGFAVHYFYLPTCPHCAEQRPIVLELQKEMRDINFFFHDASTPEGLSLYHKLASEVGLEPRVRVPAIFVGKDHIRALIGVHSKEEIRSTILECIEECKRAQAGQVSHHKSQGLEENLKEFKLPFLGKTDLTSFSLPVLAIILGLIDGFNPCAMWVLVYLIALLVGIGERKKIWLIVGSFVLASGILYFLFMTAWLNLFLFVGYLRSVTILIGLVALGGGIYGLKDFLTTKGTITCKVGDEKSHEKTISRIEELVSKPLSIAVIFGIFALAFVVNSIEFVCSSALPAVFTQILALSAIASIERYFYITLYVFFFMLDDLLIFGTAAFALSSKLGEKYARYCKGIGGAILILLGLILLFAPELLR
ncbi:MAG: hypothetical protein N3F05_01470 [Candidatus Diapherotrites archaeon]|nr:hypothetical protein [Candidatus Diapherotrites archaeon]